MKLFLILAVSFLIFSGFARERPEISRLKASQCLRQVNSKELVDMVKFEKKSVLLLAGATWDGWFRYFVPKFVDFACMYQDGGGGYFDVVFLLYSGSRDETALPEELFGSYTSASFQTLIFLDGERFFRGNKPLRFFDQSDKSKDVLHFIKSLEHRKNEREEL